MTTEHPHPIWGDESTTAAEVVRWADNRVVSATDPKSTARPASELSAQIGPTITPAGLGGQAALAIFTDVLVKATRAQDDPMNLSYIPAAPTRTALAFDAANSAANIFAGLWEAGAGAIWAENQALEWLIGLLGWPGSAAGVFVSGGTMGNLSALHAARTRASSRRVAAGLSPRPASGWRIAAAASAHSSIAHAAQVLDVDVVWVAVDDNGRLSGPAVAAAVDGLDDPQSVFAVVATGGTTNAGIIDDLASVVEVTEPRGIWLHIDAAYGGAALCAPSARGRFVGIERADSMIVDPHKWLFAPYDCCALVYRDGATARAAHTQSAAYLDTVDREAPNPSDMAIHLSRRARGLPFWFSLATHGSDRYTAAVEATLATTRTVAAAIRASAHLRLVREPDLTVLLFERKGWVDDDYDTWSKAMALEGQILCVPTKHDGRTMLRLAFVNPATDAEAVLARLTPEAMGG